MSILPLWIIYVAAAMRLSGGLAYIVATLRGSAKPNPVSWLLWSITPLISFVAGLSAGFEPALIVTLATGISPLLVFVIAMTKNHRSLQFNRLNIACFIIALSGIALWAITDHPVLAIILAITADIVSAIPTLVKITRHPYSEFLPTYFVNAFAMSLTLLATDTLDVLTIAFPTYIFVINLLIIGFIWTARSRRRHQIRHGIARARSRQRK